MEMQRKYWTRSKMRAAYIQVENENWFRIWRYVWPIT